MTMSDLAVWALGAGVLMGLCHLLCLVSPDSARRFVISFPRNRSAGRVLTAIGFVWAASLVFQMSLGRFEVVKPWIFVITPILIVLVSIYMEELLAARALGGVFLLIPAPILLTARLHESQLSVVMSVLAYVIAIKGIALVLSPYVLRKRGAFFLRTNLRARALAMIGIAVDACLIVLAFTVY